MYKRMIDNLWVAIYYGHGFNRHDRYEYDAETDELTLTKMQILPLQKVHPSKVAAFNLKTGVLTVLYDGESHPMKGSVGDFIEGVHLCFDVKKVEGAGWVDGAWSRRLERMADTRKFQKRVMKSRNKQLAKST